MSPVGVPVHGAGQDESARSATAAFTRTRTCVGCRERADPADLVRVVAVRVDGGLAVVPNHLGRLTGRGASVHPVTECVDLAERRRAFRRALRLEGEPDVTAVREWVRTHDTTR